VPGNLGHSSTRRIHLGDSLRDSLPSVEVPAEKTEEEIARVKALGDSESKRLLELANLTSEERQEIFANEWMAHLSMTPEARRALLVDRMSAMFNLDPQYRDQIRDDMREMFRGFRRADHEDPPLPGPMQPR